MSQCEICSAWFSSQIFLEEHLEKKHGVKRKCKLRVEIPKEDDDDPQQAVMIKSDTTFVSMFDLIAKQCWDQVDDLLDNCIEETGGARIDIDEREPRSQQRAMHAAAAAGRAMTIEKLIRAGADPGAVDWRKSTALHYASETSSDCVALLCEHAMDLIDMQNADGDTPLHIASASGGVDAVRQLLQTAANPNILNSEGRTCLQLSASESISDLLKQYGANPCHLSIVPAASASPPPTPSPRGPKSPLRSSPHRKVCVLQSPKQCPSPRAFDGYVTMTPYNSDGCRYKHERKAQFRERRQRRSHEPGLPNEQ